MEESLIKYNLKQFIAEKEFKEGRVISLSEIAKELKIARTTLSNIANKKGYGTTTVVIEKLCNYFGCSPGDFMTIVLDHPVKDTQGDESKKPVAE